MLMAGTAFAQQKGKVKEEVIIKKTGDGQEKTTIVIDGDRITVNGKPLAEYNGNEIVIHKREIEGLQREMEMRQREMVEAQRDMVEAQREMQRAQKGYRSVSPRAYRYNHNYAPYEYFEFNMENDLKELMKIDRTPRAYLGVGLEKADKGVRITNVSEGSAAAKAGLRTGDRITKLGGTAVTSPQQFTEMIRAKKPGEEVVLIYVKAGEKKEKKLKVKLGETSSDQMVFNLDDLDELAPMAPRSPRPPKAPRAPMSPESEFFVPIPPMPPMPAFPMEGMEGFRWEGSRPQLGIRIQDTDESNGVKVLDVADGSLAATAGIKENDVITEINGKTVKNTDEAREVIKEVNDKTSYPVKLLRNGSAMNLEVKVPKKLKKTDL
jgi:serine protease Do